MIGRNVCNEAASDECGRIHLSYECERRWLLYACRLKWNAKERTLHKICLENGMNEFTWFFSFEKRKCELGLNDIWRMGDQVN